MKNRKKSLTKSIGLLVGAMSVATIPIITTSCGTSNQINNSKKTPYLKKDSTLHVSYTDVFNNSESNIQQTLNKYFTNNDNIQNMLTDETKKDLNQDELNSLTAQVNTNDLNEKIRANNFWGQTTYENWSSNIAEKYVYEPQKQLDIDVDNGLHSVLKNTVQLLAILKESKKTDIKSKETLVELPNLDDLGNKFISLNENNQPKIVNNAFHVAIDVKESVGDQNMKTIVLEMPFSSILLNIKDFDLNLNSSNNNIAKSTQQKINLKLTTTISNISPYAEKYSKGITLNQKYEKVTTDAFLNSFNLVGVKTEIKLNNDNVSKFFGIYNVDYSNLNVQQIKDGVEVGNNGYDGFFNITVNATPISGYVWDDGSKNQKEIKLSSIPINLKLSSWQEINETDKQYTESVKLSSLNQDGVNKYFSDETNKNKILASFQKKLEEKKLISYIDLQFESAEYKYINNSSQDKRQIEVTLKMVPKAGCAFKDGINGQNNTLKVFMINVSH